MLGFFKRELVFSIAFLLALVTSFFNLDPSSWVSGVDYRTLAILFSLMGVSESMKDSGLFSYAAGMMIRKSGNTRILSRVLVMLVFFSSMFFTNDVALLMFVPLSMLVFDRSGMNEKHVIYLVVIETIAANLGSMTMPVGNPQNIYICSYFNVSSFDFYIAILPYSFVSFLLVLLALRIFLWRKGEIKGDGTAQNSFDKSKTSISIIFLVLALLSVFRIFPWKWLFLAELAYLMVFDRKVLLKIDYLLLLTFVCFFLSSVNLRSIEVVRNLISNPMKKHPILVSAAISQIISNVPAAIFLSPFPNAFRGILIGTDIGGLGSPIASLASLISLKFYFKRKEGRKGLYVLFFMALNVVFLIILSVFAYFVG